MGFGTSIVVIAIGAILRFAVSVTTTGFNLHTIGLILIIVGGVSLVLSIMFWNSWGGVRRQPRRSHHLTRSQRSSITKQEDS
jgi:uncharacterized membrane protein YidH (DUF202 family)